MKRPKTKYTFIDLFAGIGGFHYAFHELGARCLFVSEWDNYARATYKYNFQKIQPNLFKDEKKYFIGDIHDVSDLPEDKMRKAIPDFDILTGGFPCQPFSQAGKKRGFNDTRGTLFHEIKKILKAKKPVAYFLENVRNLEKHDGGKTIEIIENDLHSLGYSFFKQVIRGSDFGLPTHRPRLYMVGFFGDPNNKINFEFPKPDLNIKKITLKKIFNGVCTYDKRGTRVREIGFTLRVGGRGSTINNRHNWEYYWVNGKEHRINIKEAQLMMGFPKSFKFPDIPESQKMKQLGNSVAVNAIKATAEQILLHLKENDYR